MTKTTDKDESTLMERCTAAFGGPRRFHAFTYTDLDDVRHEFVFLRSKLTDPAMFDQLSIRGDELEPGDTAGRREYALWMCKAALDSSVVGEGIASFEEICLQEPMLAIDTCLDLQRMLRPNVEVAQKK